MTSFDFQEFYPFGQNSLYPSVHGKCHATPNTESIEKQIEAELSYQGAVGHFGRESPNCYINNKGLVREMFSELLQKKERMETTKCQVLLKSPDL